MSNDKAKANDSVDDSVLEEVSGGISIGDLGGLLSPPPSSGSSSGSGSDVETGGGAGTAPQA